MTDHPEPHKPHLQPIADAFAAARQAQVAQEEAKAKREEEAASILRAYARGQMKMAIAIGNTYGWAKQDVERLISGEAEPPPEWSPDEGYDGGDGGPPDAPPPAEGDGEDGSAWKREKKPIKRLPPDCPVTPLGVDGRLCFYLSPRGQYIEMADSDHSAQGIRGLFAGEASLSWLWSFFPKFNEQKGIQTGWKPDRTAESLMAACGERGVFDPTERLRGLGCWTDDEGRLVMHAGDAVWTGGAWIKPGFVGEHVYPGASRMPRPADAAPAKLCAKPILDLLDTWAWKSDDEAALDPDGSGHKLASLLMLGWYGCCLAGAALDWRPVLWLTGDAGTGKSSLQKMIRMIMGRSLVQATDASAAGVWTRIGYSSVGVALDEAENDPNSPTMRNLVKLAREAASGGMILRGSADHAGKQFTARSAFIFSSIIIPPLNSQDLTRITVLDLAPLPAEAKPPKMEAAAMSMLGRMLRRRLVDGWSRWADTLETYRQALHRAGHDARGADQYGTLLAMSDLMRFDEGADNDTIAALAACCGRDALLSQRENPNNAEAFLNWVITIPLDVFRGGTRMTIGTLVTGAADLPGAPGGTDAISCVQALQAHGVYVEGFREAATVTIPNQHAGLAQLLRETAWRTAPGAVTSGWSQAMARLPQAEKVNSRKVGGRGWKVPAAVFLRQ